MGGMEYSPVTSPALRAPPAAAASLSAPLLSEPPPPARHRASTVHAAATNPTPANSILETAAHCPHPPFPPPGRQRSPRGEVGAAVGGRMGRRGGSGLGGRVWADVSQTPPSCRLGSFNNSWVWHDMHIVDINYPDL